MCFGCADAQCSQEQCFANFNAHANHPRVLLKGCFLFHSCWADPKVSSFQYVTRCCCVLSNYTLSLRFRFLHGKEQEIATESRSFRLRAATPQCSKGGLRGLPRASTKLDLTIMEIRQKKMPESIKAHSIP